MARRAPDEPGKKEQLIRIGVAVFTEKGFHNTPVEEIVAAAGVPKGSFTYYFGSKDAYALAVIEGFNKYFAKKLDRILTDRAVPPIDRIKGFMDEAAQGMERFAFRRGCLVGNLGQEIGALDDRFRVALLEVMHDWQERLRVCIDEAKQEGSVADSVDSAALARLFWYSWEGAVLGAKLERSRAPLEAVRDAFIAHLRSLAPSANQARPAGRARASARGQPRTSK
jgi:TetR/AcrR family transcriptional regulator, transcriptional repressor for nem operon